MNKLIYLLLVVVAATGSWASAEVIKSSNGCGFPLSRLPERVRPKHYELYIEPLAGDHNRVSIDLSIGAPERETSVGYNNVVLHADNSLNISEVKLSIGGQEAKISNLCHDEEYELLVIKLEQDLPAEPTDARLEVEFSTELREDGHGLHKSVYLDRSKNQHVMAVTSFKPTDARKAFPCFDEPEFKATFELNIVQPDQPDMVALANTQVASEETIENGRKVVKFAKSPLMSTYQVAFVVGEFKYTEQTWESGGFNIRLYVTPDEFEAGNRGRFALDIALRAFKKLNEIFVTDIPIDHMNLVAVPEFETSENLGLIIMKDSIILGEESDTAPINLEEVAQLITEKLAQQWVGSLVTAKWWSDSWLNEGLSTWLSYHILQDVYPYFDNRHIFLLHNHLRALDNDGQQKTHAVRPSIDLINNEEIASMFDTITHEKSASIFRILHDDFLGPELFLKSLRQYVYKHQLGTTTTDDLISSMEEVSNMTVRPIVDSWTKQPGHPVLTVVFDNNNNAIALKQQRFMTDVKRDARSIDEMRQQWIIPVTILVAAPGKQQVLKLTLADGQQVQGIHLPSWFKLGEKGHWLKLNHELTGFYRVKYPVELLKLLEDPIRQKTMSPADRLNVLNDAHVFWLADEISGADYINILTWYDSEIEGAVVTGLVTNARDILQLAMQSDKGLPLEMKLRAFVAHLLGNHLDEVPTFSNGGVHLDPLDEDGLAKALRLLVLIDEQQAAKKAIGLFEEVNGDIDQLQVALRKPIYQAIARFGSDDQYTQLLDFLERTKSRAELNRLVPAMARSPHVHRLNRLTKYLEQAWQDLRADFSMQDINSTMKNTIIDAVGREPLVRQLAEGKKKKPLYKRVPFKKTWKALRKLFAKSKKGTDLESAVENYLAKVGKAFKLKLPKA